MPLFSVVIPTFNDASVLAEALSSVEAQTFEDWEIIVVDDGSTDRTVEICTLSKQRVGERFRYIRRPHRGVSAARNTGIAAATAEFIAFLDSDDQFYPEKLGILSSLFARVPEADFAFSSSRLWGFYQNDENGLELSTRLIRRPYPELLSLGNNVIMTPAVVVRRSAALDEGGFDEAMTICEDLDLWRRICRSRKSVAFSRPLVAIRTRQTPLRAMPSSLAGRFALYDKALREDPALPLSLKRQLYLELLKLLKDRAEDEKRVAAGVLLAEISDWAAGLDDDAFSGALSTLRERMLFAAATLADDIDLTGCDDQLPNSAEAATRSLN